MLRKSLERPHILHVDADPEVLGVVAHALGTAADVMSVNSIEDARRALSTQRFDLAVLDFELRPGLDLLPELRGRGDDAIPVIISSTHGDGPVGDPQVQADPSKSRAALDSLVTTVKDRLRERSTRASTEIA